MVVSIISESEGGHNGMIITDVRIRLGYTMNSNDMLSKYANTRESVSRSISSIFCHYLVSYIYKT